MIQISIVIVSYNVKEFILNLFESIEKARKGLNIEVIIVDNASADGSLDFFKSHLGNKVKLIGLKENLGFARANNIAFEQALGKYILVINPDTLMKDDTLTSIYNFMEEHPEVAMSGCKLLNPDGSFAPESKRSIPRPLSALWRMIGLNKLFPGNKYFSEYYVPWVGENEVGEVPAISGAFMFCRSDFIKKVGGFDEQFFMYGEDLDLCYRVGKENRKIYYFPKTSIIHYKGESTKTDSLDYTIYFYKAMIQFFRKHYGKGASRPFHWLVTIGVIIRGFTHFLKRMLSRGFVPIVDTLLINLLVAVFFTLRFSYKSGFENFTYARGFFIIHILATAFYLFFAYLNKLFLRRQLVLGAMVKSLTMMITTLAAFTFFIKELAFSRFVVAVTYIASIGVLSAWRVLAARSKQSLLGRFFRPRVIVVGGDAKSQDILEKLMRMPDNALDIRGVVVREDVPEIRDIAGIPVVGSLLNLPSVLDFIKPEIVIFLTGQITYNEIMDNMEGIARQGIQIRIIPENMEVLIGKSFVEHFDDLPMVDFNVAYWQPINRILKRSFDLFSASFIFLFTFPFYLAIKLIYRKQISAVQIRYGKNSTYFIFPIRDIPLDNWKNIFLLLPSIIRGIISWSGAMIDRERDYYSHFVGLTGPVRQYDKKLNADEMHDIEKHYLVNYSFFSDLKYFLKVFF